MRADGVRRAIAFVTSAYSSYSACRQYLDDIDRAVGLPPGQGRPGSTRSARTSTTRASSSRSPPPWREALAQLPAAAQAGARLVFTAHSVPVGMAAASGSPSAGTAVPGAPGGRYAAELREASRLITERVRGGSCPPISSSRAGAARRACPGWSRT